MSIEWGSAGRSSRAYCYIYCIPKRTTATRVFASHIWQQLFAPDPLSRTAGETVWKKLLIHGGACACACACV